MLLQLNRSRDSRRCMQNASVEQVLWLWSLGKSMFKCICPFSDRRNWIIVDESLFRSICHCGNSERDKVMLLQSGTVEGRAGGEGLIYVMGVTQGRGIDADLYSIAPKPGFSSMSYVVKVPLCFEPPPVWYAWYGAEVDSTLGCIGQALQ